MNLLEFSPQCPVSTLVLGISILFRIDSYNVIFCKVLSTSHQTRQILRSHTVTIPIVDPSWSWSKLWTSKTYLQPNHSYIIYVLILGVFFITVRWRAVTFRVEGLLLLAWFLLCLWCLPGVKHVLCGATGRDDGGCGVWHVTFCRAWSQLRKLWQVMVTCCSHIDVVWQRTQL